jgi:hypothetical protein
MLEFDGFADNVVDRLVYQHMRCLGFGNQFPRPVCDYTAALVRQNTSSDRFSPAAVSSCTASGLCLRKSCPDRLSEVPCLACIYISAT